MNTKYIAPYLLRFYAWQLLKANTDMDESDYAGKNPIIPANEEPDFQQFNHPYIVYGYAESPTTQLYARQTGNMAFMVYSTDDREINTIIQVIAQAFQRGDESATDVNEFTSTIPEFLGIRFGTISVAFVSSIEPPTEEGGRLGGMVNIRYEYYIENPAVTTSLAHWNYSTKRYVKNT